MVNIALLCAGAMSFEDAVLLVNKRGTYMQEAVPVGKGAMAAVIGADIEKIKAVCAEVEGTVCLANWNSEAQVVISGEKEAVEKAVEGIGASKNVFLPVSAPFHSEMMQPAEDRLAVDLDNIDFKDLKYPVINNVAVEEITTGAQARESLKKQVTRPVLWHSTMVKMLQENKMAKFAEIGAGKVLAGLVKRTARSFDVRPEVLNFQNLEDISK